MHGRLILTDNVKNIIRNNEFIANIIYNIEKIESYGDKKLFIYTLNSLQFKIIQKLYNSEVESTKNRLVYEQLLTLLLESMSNKPMVNDEKRNKNLWLRFALMIAGLLYAICEAIDSGVVIFSLFAGPVGILAGAIGFSLLSVGVFYAFNLRQISANLGIESKEAPSIIERQFAQLLEIRALKQSIFKRMEHNLNYLDIEHLIAQSRVLLSAYVRLHKESKGLSLVFNNFWINFWEKALSISTGVLYGSGGFFLGTSVLSIFFVGGPPLWLGMLISAIVAVAGFSLYWFLERPAMQDFVWERYGLNRDKITELADEKQITADMFDLGKHIALLHDRKSYQMPELPKRVVKDDSELDFGHTLFSRKPQKFVDDSNIKYFYKN